MRTALIAAVVLALAPGLAMATELLVYNASGQPVRIGTERGPLIADGRGVRYTLVETADDLVLYMPASRCAYHYPLSARAPGFPWRQAEKGVFKVQLGINYELALLPQDADSPMLPAPRQRPPFPLFPPRLNCKPR